MNRFVPDASVILKWVMPAERESDVEQALDILGAFANAEIELLVPPLWLYEIGNTVARKVPDDAEAILGDLVALGMEEPRIDDRILHEAVRLAARYAVTFYDATYHALALTREAVLVTADRRYLHAVAPDARTLLLADWG